MGIILGLHPIISFACICNYLQYTQDDPASNKIYGLTINKTSLYHLLAYAIK